MIQKEVLEQLLQEDPKVFCINGCDALSINVTMMREYRKKIISEDTPDGIDKGEFLANLTLALRHCEDARSRLENIIHAYQSLEALQKEDDTDKTEESEGSDNKPVKG